MSRTGRFQDALHDALYGYEGGYGDFTPGLLHDLGYDRVSEVIDRVVDIATYVYTPTPSGSE
jgi:hypothetical protein